MNDMGRILERLDVLADQIVAIREDLNKLADVVGDVLNAAQNAVSLAEDAYQASRGK